MNSVRHPRSMPSEVKVAQRGLGWLLKIQPECHEFLSVVLLLLCSADEAPVSEQVSDRFHTAEANKHLCRNTNEHNSNSDQTRSACAQQAKTTRR